MLEALSFVPFFCLLLVFFSAPFFFYLEMAEKIIQENRITFTVNFYSLACLIFPCQTWSKARILVILCPNPRKWHLISFFFSYIQRIFIKMESRKLSREKETRCQSFLTWIMIASIRGVGGGWVPQWAMSVLKQAPALLKWSRSLSCSLSRVVLHKTDVSVRPVFVLTVVKCRQSQQNGDRINVSCCLFSLSHSRVWFCFLLTPWDYLFIRSEWGLFFILELNVRGWIRLGCQPSIIIDQGWNNKRGGEPYILAISLFSLPPAPSFPTLLLWPGFLATCFINILASWYPLQCHFGQLLVTMHVFLLSLVWALFVTPSSQLPPAPLSGPVSWVS